MTWIAPVPWSRYNDDFIQDQRITAQAPDQDISHPLISISRPNIATRHQADFYQHFAADIVTESVFDYPYPYITEKTLRPIACKRMFFMVGAAGTLALLRDLGFQTFDDIMDHAYDSITDASTRFLAVMAAVEQFCTIPLPEVKQYMLDNQSRFQHNFDVLQTLPEKTFRDLT